MGFHRLSGETRRLAYVLHFDSMSFGFPEECQPPTLSPERIVTLSLDFLQELLLRKLHRILNVLIFPDIKYIGSDDPRLVNIDDIDF